MKPSIEKLMQQGISAHQAGRLQEAEKYYKNILQNQSNHPHANHNLGILSVSLNNPDNALNLFKRAIHANPNIDQFWMSYISTLIKEHQFDDAKQALKKAKKKGLPIDKLNALSQHLFAEKKTSKPFQSDIDQLVSLYNQRQFSAVIKNAQILTKKHPEVLIIWNILGASATQMRMLDIAVTAFEKVISLNPNYAEGYSNLGNALKDQGKLKKAIEAHKKSISLKPDYAEAYCNMGNTLVKQGNLDEAVEAFNKSILLKPDYIEAYNNMGNILKELDKLEEAIIAFEKVISLNPNYAEAYNNMGATLQEQGKLDESLKVLKKSVSLKPDYAEAYSNIGVTLQEQFKLDEAIVAYKKSIFFQPNVAETYSNMGRVLQDQGNLEDSINAFNKSILLKPDYAEAHQNLSFALLNSGKLQEGLDQYEWRWKNTKFSSHQRSFSQPLWDGKKSLKGKTILLWCEQGIGDTLNWSSCLSLLTSEAEHCILECQKKLIPLLKRSFPKVEIKPTNKKFDLKRDDFDFHLPMGSLYKHFINQIRQNTKIKPYLVPDPDRVNFWKKRLNCLGKGPYIGISWKSSVVSPYRLQHYPPISEWSRILTIPNITFINLQYINFVDDLSKIKDKFGVTVHNFEDLDLYNDIDDVAALSAALDIVVSTKVTPLIFSAGVGTPTKIANWRQSVYNNFLLNPVSSCVEMYERNTWETWDNVFQLIADDISKQKNNINNFKDKL